MATRDSGLIGKLAAVLAPSLLIVGLFTTLALAAPAAPHAANSIFLQGGGNVVNNAGSGQTTFSTTTTLAGWYFENVMTNSTTMLAECLVGPACQGVHADANQIGLSA